MRDLDRSSEGKGAGDAIVGGFLSLPTAERVGPGVERGVVQNESQPAIVEILAVGLAVAEGLVERERPSSK